MGNKTSKGEKAENHVAFPTRNFDTMPNIIITQPTPINQPDSPNPFLSAPPPSPRGTRSMESFYEETPILTANTTNENPPEKAPPPPPPSVPPPAEPPKYGVFHDEVTRKKFGESVLERIRSPIPPPPEAVSPPVIKRNIMYAKDKIALFEGMNTVERPKVMPQLPKKDDFYATKSNRAPIGYNNDNQTETSSISSKANTMDDYPIYNPISDYTYKAGMSYQTGAFPIDANRQNFGFCGRSGAGKSTLINALRGLSNGDPQSAGRNPCDRMEPFRFIEGDLQQTVLWEIPYPRTFFAINAVFDANMGFDKFYESHKLRLFKRLFILIPDGAPTDEDITFARVAHSRRTSITFLSTKSDDDLDAESRETGRGIDQQMKQHYEKSARAVFAKYLQKKAQILNSIELLFVSAPTTRNLVSGTVGYLHYLLDEERLLEILDLKTGCHYELESKLRKEREEITRPSRMDIENHRIDNYSLPQPYGIEKSTVLADAGFEIMYGTDDRVYGSLEPKTMIRRAGKTCFNYGLIGGNGVGKSALIDAMRGMNSKHPLSATKCKSKAGTCERFEFDDDILKYSVTLYELHYPKKINSYFEFIDKFNIASFTALFILVDQYPSDADLAFAKIAYRRSTTILFLVSKCDKKLAARSRSDEIPVCDLLKQRYIDKAMDKFEKTISNHAAELRGRVNIFFVSAPVFKALRNGDPRGTQFVLHERAVFDFLKSRRMIADMLDNPPEMREGLYANVNLETAGTL
ncbi:unnamed protein product [Caenorhabditis bovis]|uniref:IRG-type G domain-containing protein n=1 Tax=Caenorhabditis bovis TaxID=2654633 RepID=A0A8S1FD47_9PELO|nr:unnamed protein product [Caenorhabditis bovis]